MSDIEKEFFEAFGIDKVRECELRSECFLGFAHTCDKCDIYGQAFAVYPPITSDIVLGLEKLLGSFCCGTIAFRSAYWYKLPIQHIWWTEDKKEEFVENTRIEALLSLFIEYKENIDQNEVKALFKC